MSPPAPIAVRPLPLPESAAYAALLERSDADLGPYLDGARRIIDAVRADGDAALKRFARAYDGAADLPAVRQPADAFDAAEARLDGGLKAALRRAHDNVRRFHERHRPEPMRLDVVSPGVLAGERVRPIPSVACYAPRGKGAFPSTVIMTATIAAVAGVPQRILLSPPTPDGGVDDATLFAARLCGIDAVYAAGGAQAVAAVAYGTESVPRCAKIVGPGSLWFVAAKQLLADRIDGGLPAGPSEAIVLALGPVDGRLAALDLIIESEHGPATR
ncbi:MAG: histidinol dehydrogenase [Pseudomonadota bacterium]